MKIGARSPKPKMTADELLNYVGRHNCEIRKQGNKWLCRNSDSDSGLGKTPRAAILESVRVRNDRKSKKGSWDKRLREGPAPDSYALDLT